MARQPLIDTRKAHCQYCGAQLTNEELRLIAEADGLTVDEILDHPKLTELMCDKCAEG